MDPTDLWHNLEPGTVFLFDDKHYLRTTTGILSLQDFASVALHNDVTVEVVGKLSGQPKVRQANSTTQAEDIILRWLSEFSTDVSAREIDIVHVRELLSLLGLPLPVQESRAVLKLSADTTRSVALSKEEIDSLITLLVDEISLLADNGNYDQLLEHLESVFKKVSNLAGQLKIST